MKVKTFYVCNGTTQLQEDINTWIAENNPDIKFVTQCASGRLDHHVTTTIFYTEKVGE
jgi:hypothetical protein